MEPRSAIGEYDRTTGEHTLWTTSQNPHVIRLLMGAFVLQHPGVQAPRGRRPTSAAASAARSTTTPRRRSSPGRRGKLHRPVKWTSDRSEAFISDAHGRDHVTTCELALDEQRQVPRPPRPHPRQHGRLPLHLRALRADLPLRHPARRRVRDAHHLRRGQGGVHLHRRGRRLPRRRPAGGDLPPRTSRGRRRGGDGHRPRRDPPAQLHPDRVLPVPDAGGAAIRQRRLLRDARPGAGSGRLVRLRAAARGGGQDGQAPRHRHLHLRGGLRHRALGRGRLARRPRRALRGRHHPRPSRRAASPC